MLLQKWLVRNLLYKKRVLPSFFNLKAVILLFLTLTSCFKQTLTLRPDSTGMYSLNLDIDNSALVFFETLRNTKSSVDLDLFFLNNENKLRTDLRDYKNLRIRNISITQIPAGKRYSIDLFFTKSLTLPETMLEKYITNSIREERNSIIVKTIINLELLGNKSNLFSLYDTLNSEMKETVNAFSSIINFTFSYTGPSEILRTSSLKRGITSSNNMTVEYSYTLTELLQAKNNIEITTTFRK